MNILVAPFIAAPIVGTALVVFVFLTRLINARYPLLSAELPPKRWEPGPDAPTVRIHVGRHRAAVAVPVPDDAQWVVSVR